MLKPTMDSFLVPSPGFFKWRSWSQLSNCLRQEQRRQAASRPVPMEVLNGTNIKPKKSWLYIILYIPLANGGTKGKVMKSV